MQRLQFCIVWASDEVYDTAFSADLTVMEELKISGKTGKWRESFRC